MSDLSSHFMMAMDELGRRLVIPLEDVLTRFATTLIMESLRRQVRRQIAETEEETHRVLAGLRVRTEEKGRMVENAGIGGG